MKNATFRKLKRWVRFNFRKNEGFSVKFTERTHDVLEVATDDDCEQSTVASIASHVLWGDF